MDFKSQFSKGFARPNLFRVNISTVKASEQFKYEMGCFQAQIPGHNIATTDKDTGKRSVAYQKIYSDVILGFYVSADLTELKFWQAWIDRIVRPDPNRHNYYNNYIGLAKTNLIREESMRTGNASESGQYNGRAQRFYAPQPIEVSGVEYYAYIKNNPGQDSIMVITTLNDYTVATDSIGLELARDTSYVIHHTFTINLPNMSTVIISERSGSSY